MTAKRKQVENLIREYVPKWISLLKLQDWSIDVNYMRGHGELDSYGFRTHANCSANWEHKTALICFWGKSLRNNTKADIEYTVVHELMHIAVNEMREEGIKHEERTVTQLSKVVLGISND